MTKKKVLTKVKTRVSTRTMLLVALGLVIIGGVAAGVVPMVSGKTFNIKDAGLLASGRQLTSVVFAGQGGTANAAVPKICSALKSKGLIKYEIDYAKSRAANTVLGYCPRRGSSSYQAYNKSNGTFYIGNCWGGHNLYLYTKVVCAAKPSLVPPYTSPYSQPYTYRPPYSATGPYIGPYTTPYTSSNIYSSIKNLTYDYAIVSMKPYPATLKPGQLTNVWVYIKNTGTATWYNSGTNVPIVRLGTGSVYGAPNQQRDYASEFAAPSWISPSRAATINRNSVRPGSSVIFSFAIKAPQTPGVYKAYFTPVVDNVTWMKDVGMYWQITVKK